MITDIDIEVVRAKEAVLAFVAAWRDWDLTRRPPALPTAIYQTASALADLVAPRP
jgi:hypothetical protein